MVRPIHLTNPQTECTPLSALFGLHLRPATQQNCQLFCGLDIPSTVLPKKVRRVNCHAKKTQKSTLRGLSSALSVRNKKTYRRMGSVDINFHQNRLILILFKNRRPQEVKYFSFPIFEAFKKCTKEVLLPEWHLLQPEGSTGLSGLSYSVTQM